MTHQPEFITNMKELVPLGHIKPTLLFHKLGIMYRKVLRMLLQKPELVNGDALWPLLVAYSASAAR